MHHPVSFQITGGHSPGTTGDPVPGEYTMKSKFSAAAALLLCAGAAHAQSSVTLYGTIDTGLGCDVPAERA